MTIDNVTEYLAQHEQKELLRFVAVGSVDDGKSTLIGRLLFDSHGIYEDQLAAVESASKKRGTVDGGLDLALLTDGLRAEREQGITIDVAYRYFSTDKRKFIIADTPGHVQYTRNMTTGASTASVALILIDARHGVQQQSRRHAYIASLLGISSLAVCVNKMDLVDFDQRVFDDIRADFESFVDGLSFSDVRFLPVSAVAGDNVVHPSERTPWHTGGTLLAYLEDVPLLDTAGASFRYPVQYVLRPDLDYRGFCGQIASGSINKGDEVTVYPSGMRTTVAAIDTFEGEIEHAHAPMSVTMRLTDEVDISRGDMITHADDVPTIGRRYEAHVVWMNEAPLDRTKSYFLKHTTRLVRANIDLVHGKVDLENLAEVEADALELNDIGRVELSCNQAICVDPYASNRQMGGFVLIDALTNNTVGAGMIVRALDDGSGGQRLKRHSLISRAERRTRLGHGPMVIWFDGEPAAGQPAVAYALERALFVADMHATVIDVDAIAESTRSSLLFADLARQGYEAGLITIISSGLPRSADRQAIRDEFVREQLLTLHAVESSPTGVVWTDDTSATVEAIVAALHELDCVDRPDG